MSSDLGRAPRRPRRVADRLQLGAGARRARTPRRLRPLAQPDQGPRPIQGQADEPTRAAARPAGAPGGHRRSARSRASAIRAPSGELAIRARARGRPAAGSWPARRAGASGRPTSAACRGRSRRRRGGRTRPGSRPSPTWIAAAAHPARTPAPPPAAGIEVSDRGGRRVGADPAGQPPQLQVHLGGDVVRQPAAHLGEQRRVEVGRARGGGRPRSTAARRRRTGRRVGMIRNVSVPRRSSTASSRSAAVAAAGNRQRSWTARSIRSTRPVGRAPGSISACTNRSGARSRAGPGHDRPALGRRVASSGAKRGSSSRSSSTALVRASITPATRTATRRARGWRRIGVMSTKAAGRRRRNPAGPRYRSAGG